VERLGSFETALVDADDDFMWTHMKLGQETSAIPHCKYFTTIFFTEKQFSNIYNISTMMMVVVNPIHQHPSLSAVNLHGD